MRFVDLFAGFGGFTCGAEQASGELVWAANHWPLAVQTHAANHPSGRHECQDLRQADFSALPTYDVLLASPACQGHSQCAQPARARQAATRRTHDALRATAWAVVDCADVTRPPALVVENVPDFRRWALYPVWREALEVLGYHLTESVLDASALGVPQRRKRLFIAGSLRRAPNLDFSRAEEPAFGPHIEWAAGNWRPVGKASHGARRRIELARKRHGQRFLTQHVTNHPGVPLDEAIRTVTTKDQWAVVDGDSYRPLTQRETARAMGFPDAYQVPNVSRADWVRGFGNAVCPPVAARVFGRAAEAT